MFNHSYKITIVFPESSKIKATSWRGETFLKTVLLQEKEHVLAKDLAHGEKARTCDVISFKTDVLLLDEPTAGISVEEVPAILQVIENIKKHPESTIVLIEHKMDMVLGLSDHLIVLFHGELLAEGLPEEIMKDERVQSAYLGDYIVALLQVNNIETYLEQFHILQGVSLTVEKGTITVLFGRNGAGKTTTLRSVMGFHHIAHGEIYYDRTQVNGLSTHLISRKGIGYVPENQGIFHDLTVEETFALARGKGEEAEGKIEWMLELFPDLKQFWHKKWTLKRGQKQMLAISRAFINSDGLLLIDEPSKGLSPL